MTVLLLTLVFLVPLLGVLFLFWCLYFLKKSDNAIRDLNSSVATNNPAPTGLLGQHYRRNQIYFSPIAPLAVEEDLTDHECLPTYDEVISQQSSRQQHRTPPHSNFVMLSKPPSYHDVIIDKWFGFTD